VNPPIPAINPYSKLPNNNPIKTGKTAATPAQNAFTQGNGFLFKLIACFKRDGDLAGTDLFVSIIRLLLFYKD
jgi:hypothetical protein